MNRDNSLDVIRCVMNYMIVVLHSWAAFQYVRCDTVEFYAWTVICSHVMWLAIPSFFMISGYLLFQQFSLRSWPKKMVRRVRRLVVPYLAWNLLFVVFYLTMSRLVPRLGARVSSFGLDTIGGAISKIVSLSVAPIDGPLWFLRVLFFFALVSPILWWMMRLAKGWILLVLTFAWCVVEGAVGLTESLRLTAPAYALACFIAGGALAMNKKDLVSEFRHWSWFSIGVVACLTRAVIAICRSCIDAELGGVVDVVLSLLAIIEAPALISLASCLPMNRIVANRTYGFLKEMSFFAYAGHFLFCSMWLHTSAPFFGWMGTGKMTVLIFIFVACGIITMAWVYGISKRCCPKVVKVFDGTL